MDKNTKKFLEEYNLYTAEEQLEQLSNRDLLVVPTGVPVLDTTLLRIGGFPPGRLIEIFGESDSHKSVFLYRNIIPAFLRHFPDKKVLLIETESTLSDKFGMEWLKSQGVDMSRLIVEYSDNVEYTLNLLTNAAKSGLFSLLALDSLGNAEVSINQSGDRFKQDKKEGTYKTDKIGEFARRVGDGTKALKSAMRATRTTAVFINQVRSNLDPYGLEYLTPGGHVFHHNRDISLHFSPKKDLKVNDEVVGKVIGMTLVRSKVCPKNKTDVTNHYELFYSPEGQVKSDVESYVNVGVDIGVVAKKGAWLTWGNHRFQGFTNCLAHLLSNPNDLEELKELITKAQSKVDSKEHDDLYSDQTASISKEG